MNARESGVKARLVRTVLIVACFWLAQLSSASLGTADPLPSWQEGPTKDAIIDYVRRVTTVGSPDYVPEPERLATFDNDGTLWCEQPVVQLAFVSARLAELLPDHPEWAERPAIQAAISGDVAYFQREGEAALLEVVTLTHAGMTLTEFRDQVRAFFATARHPQLGASYTDLAYQPMLELLSFLRDHGFHTWITSGGGAEFMRVISDETYGIPPHQVIGSMGGLELQERDGEVVLVKTPTLLLLDDRSNKPVAIALHTGGTPILAVGNVRSGGDIAMLRYSQTSPWPNLQLLVNHDDADREYAYGEQDNASLDAAAEYGWVVVSIRNDWARVFSARQQGEEQP
jgi:hypothetical protein